MAGRKPGELTEKVITGPKYFEELLLVFQRLHEIGCEEDTADNRDLRFDVCDNFFWRIPTGFGIHLEMLFETQGPQSLTRSSRRVLHILCVRSLSDRCVSENEFLRTPGDSIASVVRPRVVAHTRKKEKHGSSGASPSRNSTSRIASKTRLTSSTVNTHGSRRLSLAIVQCEMGACGRAHRSPTA